MKAERRKRLGARGEDAAARHLIERGYTLLERNYRIPSGEVDIIAEKAHTLVFVEVKTRSSPRFGTPAEAVDIKKRRRICGAALQYVSDNAAGDTPARFDVIEVFAENGGFRVRHITDAFSFEAP